MRKFIVLAAVVLFFIASVSTVQAAQPKTVTVLQPVLLKAAQSCGYTVGWKSRTMNNVGTLFFLPINSVGIPTTYVSAAEWHNVGMISSPHSYVMSEQTYRDVTHWLKKYCRIKRL